MNAPFRLPGRPQRLALTYQSGSTESPPFRKTVGWGYLALFAVLAGFFVWATLAPLHSAAIAPGLLRAEGGGRRVVQHLEGGIVSRLLVREGSRVAAGQPLAELDDTASSAQDAALRANYDMLLAHDARLTAERSGASHVTYPVELESRKAEPQVAEIIRASEQVFRAGRRGLVEQVAILSQRAGQGQADLAGTAPQIAQLDEQARSLTEEVAAVQTLVNERLERRSRLLVLQRQQAEVAAQRSRLLSGADRLGSAIGEARAQMVFVRGQQVTDAAKQQREVQASLAEAREKLSVSEDINRRRRILAPVAGVVTNLRLITPGAVLGAGQPLLDLVPNDGETVIIARLNPIDIDVVHPGLTAEVRLTPYKARSVPTLVGRVKKVGADVIADDKSQTFYYELEVVLDKAELARLRGVRLVSGMPAEVYVQLGSRSLFQYFTQPLTDSLRRAFRED